MVPLEEPGGDASTRPDAGAPDVGPPDGGAPDGGAPDVSRGSDAVDAFADSGDGGSDAFDGGTDEPAEPMPEGGDPRCTPCAAYGPVKEVAPVPEPLTELSGITASLRHPGIFYAHNDSGDTARFFAMDDDAEVRAELDLRGVVATDWEDMAMGPCPTGFCIYIGDIGDNNLVRAQYSVLRVAEPAELPDGGEVADIAYESFPFVYPDGPHNAETLVVHPATGRIFVVTKVAGEQAAVYELPLPLKAGEVATLIKVMPVSLPASAGLITSGDFHPCSHRLLLRTYSALYELTGVDGIPESIFAADPVQIPVAVEAQGEAVTYGVDGRSYYTAGESVATPPRATLNVVSCP